MRKVYPTFIAEHEGSFLVYVPDMDIYTEGRDMADAICMARDSIGLKGIALEDENIELPEPSTYSRCVALAKENNDIFDYSQGIPTMVDVDFTEYRRKNDKKSVRRNVTLPNWLDFEAEKEGINFSKVLQEALKQRLGVN